MKIKSIEVSYMKTGTVNKAETQKYACLRDVDFETAKTVLAVNGWHYHNKCPNGSYHVFMSLFFLTQKMLVEVKYDD